MAFTGHKQRKGRNMENEIKISRKEFKKRKKEFLIQAIKEKDSLKLQYPQALLMHSVDKASIASNRLSGVVIILTIVLVAIGILSFTVGVKIGSTDGTEIGRYQVIKGPYRIEDMRNNTETEQTCLFLLDSATGEVKRHYSLITPNNTLLEGWGFTDLRDKVPPLKKNPSYIPDK